MDVDEGMPDMAGSAPHNQDTGRMPSPGEWMSSALVDESSPPLSTLSETSHPSQEHQPESLDLQTDISYSRSSRHGPVDADRYETSPDLDEAKSKTISYIERWEDLSCIRFLNHVHKKGGVDNRGYQILYRMCQLIWAIGHEVEIRKKVKLPRAQRLAKLQSYCGALVQGAKLWQKNMKAHVYHVLDVIFSLPRLRSGDAFQNLEPKLNEWYEAMR